MSGTYSKVYLRRLRNEIDITAFIADVLRLEHRQSDGQFRFLCPECQEFNTAINRKTNLARCFRCQHNYNPIDMTMRVKGMTFRDAVELLAPYLSNPHLRREIETGPRNIDTV